MRRLVVLALLAALAPPALAQQTVYIVPDAPTNDPGGSGAIFLPWDVVAYKSGVYGPIPVWSLPAPLAIDALHKLDKPGRWLFSPVDTIELPPGSGSFYQPEDVVGFDGASFAMRFDGSAAGVPAGVNVDALFLVGDDLGDLVVSFDVPATIAAATYEPADLVRYAAGVFSLYFDASAGGAGIAPASDAVAVDESAGAPVLGFDVPTDLLPVMLPPGTFERGQIATWNGALYAMFENLAGWPQSSEVAALACQANPGRVYERGVYPLPIRLAKSLVTPGNIVITWSPSCSSGAEDYGIYEGTLGTWTSHVAVVCGDAGGDFAEELTPGAGSRYHLVVPYNASEEGSYGRDAVAGRVPLEIERPASTGATCAPNWIATACPP